jgi:dihydroxyacetone kinase-like predicted kinase
MDDQTSEWIDDRRSSNKNDTTLIEKVETAVVAVAAGDGLSDLIVSTGLGATSVVEGGDSMNPSVSELLRAVEAAPSDQVILLPNNKNILSAALEVPALSKKDVRVIPTRSVQSGVAALLEFNTTVSLEENEAAMNEVVSDVGDGRVCRASRDVTVYSHEIREGMAFATFDDEIVAVGRDPLFVLSKMIENNAVNAEIVTVYTGESLTEEQVAATSESLESKFENVEFEVVYGGQPHYEYLVAVE